MIKIVFSIYDKKAGVYCMPFYLANKMLGVRALMGAVMDKNTDIGKFPADYELYELGTFDDESGSMQCGMPTFVASGSQMDAQQGDLFSKEMKRA